MLGAGNAGYCFKSLRQMIVKIWLKKPPFCNRKSDPLHLV